MAAQRAVVLENHTKLFVEAKVGERIKMEFATGQVQIKPESKHGSTTLGAFWVRVVQAYFPKEEFTYTKRYCSKYGSESLSVSIYKNFFWQRMRWDPHMEIQSQQRRSIIWFSL